MTTVVISQPMYFPWPGFLVQMAMADAYIWLDDAIFSKGSFTNRVQVKTDAGQKWMSIALADKGSGKRISDLESSVSDWSARHRSLLQQSLRNRPFQKQALGVFDGVTDCAPDTNLCETLIASCEKPAAELGVLPPQILRSSSMNVPGDSSQRVLDLVLSVGGTRYLTGHGAINYLDHEAFENAGVEVEYMDYQIEPWHQGVGDFTPFVTILDLISALPYKEAASHLKLASVPWRSFLKKENRKT